MFKSLRLFIFLALFSIPYGASAAVYETYMRISLAEQQWFTDLMQSNIAIDPDVYRGMPLAHLSGPVFENGVYVQFMIFKSDDSDIYNILAAPTFRAGYAYGSGIDLDDREDFWIYNDLVFVSKDDLYIIHVLSDELSV